MIAFTFTAYNEYCCFNSYTILKLIIIPASSTQEHNVQMCYLEANERNIQLQWRKGFIELNHTVESPR